MLTISIKLIERWALKFIMKRRKKIVNKKPYLPKEFLFKLQTNDLFIRVLLFLVSSNYKFNLFSFLWQCANLHALVLTSERMYYSLYYVCTAFWPLRDHFLKRWVWVRGGGCCKFWSVFPENCVKPFQVWDEMHIRVLKRLDNGR